MTTNQQLSYTVEDAVQVTGLSRSRLYQAIRAGSLTTWKAGKRRMVSRKALEQFISRLERESQGRAA